MQLIPTYKYLNGDLSDSWFEYKSIDIAYFYNEKVINAYDDPFDSFDFPDWIANKSVKRITL